MIDSFDHISGERTFNCARRFTDDMFFDRFFDIPKENSATL